MANAVLKTRVLSNFLKRQGTNVCMLSSSFCFIVDSVWKFFYLCNCCHEITVVLLAAVTPILISLTKLPCKLLIIYFSLQTVIDACTLQQSWCTVFALLNGWACTVFKVYSLSECLFVLFTVLIVQVNQYNTGLFEVPKRSVHFVNMLSILLPVA